MKNTTSLLLFSFMLIIGCKKETSDSLSQGEPTPEIVSQGFKTYLIKAGRQFSDQNGYNAIAFSELTFVVKFDSTAIYTTVQQENQYDINKLYGFSDNNSDHHKFSARFGWRWSDNALHLFAYTYNEGVRASKKLGSVTIGSENICSIKIDGDRYIFGLNDRSDTLRRESTTMKAVGYSLYPYFGGDEAAPHDIKVFIKELP